MMVIPSERQPIVIVIDDDASVRESLSRLFRSVGFQVRAYATTPDFLQSQLPDSPSCLVLDVRLQGASGLDFQTELANANVHIPIIFMTGHGDIPMTVRAMKAGAVEFLTKPFRDQDSAGNNDEASEIAMLERAPYPLPGRMSLSKSP
jgi:FixJ family two-component response regulator